MSRSQNDETNPLPPLSGGEAETQCLLVAVRAGARSPAAVTAALGLSPALAPAVAAALGNLVARGLLTGEEAGCPGAVAAWAVDLERM